MTSPDVLPETIEEGSINNYAYGYQDCIGIGGPALVIPKFPENRSYMRGWFSARISQIESPKKIVRQPKAERDLIIAFNKTAKEKGWEAWYGGYNYRSDGT